MSFQRDLASPWVRLSTNECASPKRPSFLSSSPDASSSKYLINDDLCFVFFFPRVSTETLAVVLCTYIGGQRLRLLRTQEPGLPRETPRLTAGLCVP